MRMSIETEGASISSTATRIRYCRTCSCRGRASSTSTPENGSITSTTASAPDGTVRATTTGRSTASGSTRSSSPHRTCSAYRASIWRRGRTAGSPALHTPVFPFTPTSLRTSSSSSARDTISTSTTFHPSSERCCSSGWMRGSNRAGQRSSSPVCPCSPAPCRPRRSRTAVRLSGSTSCPRKASWTMRSTGATTTRCIEAIIWTPRRWTPTCCASPTRRSRPRRSASIER